MARMCVTLMVGHFSEAQAVTTHRTTKNTVHHTLVRCVLIGLRRRRRRRPCVPFMVWGGAFGLDDDVQCCDARGPMRN